MSDDSCPESIHQIHHRVSCVNEKSRRKKRLDMALNYSFAGKRILITGGTRGIGRELVQFFHDDGALVYTFGSNAELVEKLKAELPKVTAEVADLNDWEKSRQVIESFGAVDFLVNNAGTGSLQSFMNITEDAAKSTFNVNVLGVINVSQVVAKGMMERGSGGVILNIGSVTARKYALNGCVYSASKASLESLTRTMAKELGPHNIRVNNMTLGYVNAGRVDYEVLGKEMADFIEDVRMQMRGERLIEVKEVAQMVAFLLSPLSSMMVGVSHVMDGGYLNA